MILNLLVEVDVDRLIIFECLSFCLIWFELCIFICGFKHVLNTKKLLKDEGPMCAIAWLIEAQGPVGKQNEC